MERILSISNGEDPYPQTIKVCQKLKKKKKKQNQGVLLIPKK
jgi:hypothetical protein